MLSAVSRIATAFFLLTGLQAHQPWLEPQRGTQFPTNGRLNLDGAVSLGDPTRVSVAMYGHLSTPNEIDLYRFTPVIDESIPVELLVPVRVSNAAFRPWVVVLSPALSPVSIQMPIPFNIPDGWRWIVIPPPEEVERKIFFEPFSFERLYRGREITINVLRGQTYYIAVFDPTHFTGSYSLAIGTREDFTDISIAKLIGNVLRIKLGLFGIEKFVWFEFAGALLFLIACMLGLLTLRVSVLAIPAICLAVIGAILLYQTTGFSGAVTFQAFFLIPILVATFFRQFGWVRSGLVFLWLVQLLFLLWHLLMLR